MPNRDAALQIAWPTHCHFFRRLPLSKAAEPLNMSSTEPKQAQFLSQLFPPDRIPAGEPSRVRRRPSHPPQAVIHTANLLACSHPLPAGTVVRPPSPSLCDDCYPSGMALVAAYSLHDPRQVSPLRRLQIPPNPLLHQKRSAAAAQGDREARRREVALRSGPSACLAQGDRLASYC